MLLPSVVRDRLISIARLGSRTPVATARAVQLAPRLHVLQHGSSRSGGVKRIFER
jgi:hypothetical protein